MADQDRLFFRKMVDQAEHIPDHLFHVVGFDRLGRIAASVAAHVRHHDTVTGLHEHADLVAP